MEETSTDKKKRFDFFRREPSDIKKIPKWLRRLLAFLAAIVLLYFFLGGRFGIVNYMRYKHYEKRLRESLVREEAKTDSLLNVIEKLKSDTLYIESIARERLNMIKPGETMIIYKDKKSVGPSHIFSHDTSRTSVTDTLNTKAIP